MPAESPTPDFERLNLTGPNFRLFLRYQAINGPPPAVRRPRIAEPRTKEEEHATGSIIVDRHPDEGFWRLARLDQQQDHRAAGLAGRGDRTLDLGRRGHLLAVDRGDHIAAPQPLFVGVAVGIDRGDDDAFGVRRQAEPERDLRVERLQRQPEDIARSDRRLVLQRRRLVNPALLGEYFLARPLADRDHDPRPLAVANDVERHLAADRQVGDEV